MKMSLLKRVGAVAGASALLMSGLSSALADQELQFGYEMPVQARVTVDETGCDNSPGPWITVEGEILLGGLQAELVFQNNVKGTHSATNLYSTNVVLALPGGSITIPKQPVRGGVGGNPWIWIQFIDASGAAMGDEILLGRCVQGLELTHDCLNQVMAAVTVDAAQCSNHRGAKITFGGGLVLSGLKAKLIFRNNLKGTWTQQAESEVNIIVNGSPVVIPKQPVQGGAGGNPLIWLQFLQGDSRPIGDPIFLGRCNQI